MALRVSDRFQRTSEVPGYLLPSPVYHYNFRMPGDDATKDAHCVMWDYNIGLVRITAVFKSLNYPKVFSPKWNSQPLQKLTIYPDHARKSYECKSRTSGYLSQHHRWLNLCSRYVSLRLDKVFLAKRVRVLGTI